MTLLSRADLQMKYDLFRNLLILQHYRFGYMNTS